MDFLRERENIKYNGWGRVWGVRKSGVEGFMEIDAGQEAGHTYLATSSIADRAEKLIDQEVEFLTGKTRVADKLVDSIFAIRPYIRKTAQ